jgi:hypothetical protein
MQEITAEPHQKPAELNQKHTISSNISDFLTEILKFRQV